MPRWWRLLFALALLAMISATIFPPGADADSPGIFNDGVSIVDLDDDFDEVLRRLRPEVAAHTPATLFEIAPPHVVHLYHGLMGGESGIWTGLLPADRGPPARSQISSPSIPSPASTPSAGGLNAIQKQPSQAPGNNDRSRKTRFSARFDSGLDNHLFVDHRPRTERNHPWPA